MKVLLIGAGGAVGAAAAKALRNQGCEVVEASRSADEQVDVTDHASVAALFERVGKVDAVVTAIGETPFKSIGELSASDFDAAWRGKALAQIDVVLTALPHLKDGGALAVTSGILSTSPIATGSTASAANGALEAFVMAASTEMPRGIRINAVSPNVLLDSPDYHAFFPGFRPVSSEEVGRAFVRAICGVETGKTFKAE